MTAREVGLTKPEHRLLERAFEAEIKGSLWHRSHLLQVRQSKALASLLESKKLAAAEITFPGRPPITISGYELTHAGRMAYCLTCEEGEDEPEAPEGG